MTNVNDNDNHNLELHPPDPSCPAPGNQCLVAVKSAELTIEKEFIDEKVQKTVVGFLKSPLVRMMLKKQTNTAGLVLEGIRIDEKGIHLTIRGSQAVENFIITEGSLKALIQSVIG